MKYIYAILFIVLLFTSCRKTIDIKLKDADKRIVIDARLTTGANDFNVLITRTGNFFGPSDVETVVDASVVLFEGVNTFNLKNEGNGNYQLPLFTATENKNYRLSVTIDGVVYEATSLLSPKVKLLDITFLFEGGSIFAGEGFAIYAEFQDAKSEVNYYRIDGTINGEAFGAIDDIVLFNDELENGDLVSYPVIGGLKSDDVVVVNLYHINLSNYNYYKELNLITNGEGDKVSPTNPASNWSNNALGNFNTMAVSTKTIVIQ